MANGIDGSFLGGGGSLTPNSQSTIQMDLQALSVLEQSPQTDRIQRIEGSILSALDQAFVQGQPNPGAMSENEIVNNLAQQLESGNGAEVCNNGYHGFGGYGGDPLAALHEYNQGLGNGAGSNLGTLFNNSSEDGFDTLGGLGGLGGIGPEVTNKDAADVTRAVSIYGDGHHSHWGDLGAACNDIINNDGASSVLGKDAQNIINDMNNHNNPGNDVRQLQQDEQNNQTQYTPHETTHQDASAVTQAALIYGDGHHSHWGDLNTTCEGIISQDGPNSLLGRDAQNVINDMNNHTDPGNNVRTMETDAGFSSSDITSNSAGL